jgi:hypothetical protein
MRQNRGPEARLREGVEDVLHGLRQLPTLADNLERATAELAGGRIRLHPETVAQLNARSGGNHVRWALPVALAALAMALAALL